MAIPGQFLATINTSAGSMVRRAFRVGHCWDVVTGNSAPPGIPWLRAGSSALQAYRARIKRDNRLTTACASICRSLYVQSWAHCVRSNRMLAQQFWRPIFGISVLRLVFWRGPHSGLVTRSLQAWLTICFFRYRTNVALVGNLLPGAARTTHIVAGVPSSVPAAERTQK